METDREREALPDFDRSVKCKFCFPVWKRNKRICLDGHREWSCKSDMSLTPPLG